MGSLAKILCVFDISSGCFFDKMLQLPANKRALLLNNLGRLFSERK